MIHKNLVGCKPRATGVRKDDQQGFHWTLTYQTQTQSNRIEEMIHKDFVGCGPTPPTGNRRHHSMVHHGEVGMPSMTRKNYHKTLRVRTNDGDRQECCQ